jgi:hypothetical protein
MSCIVALLSCLAAPASAEVYTVALDGSGDFETIQAAIDATAEGDIVEVADGVYTGVGNRDLLFPEWEITLRSANGPERCTIDCENAGRAATLAMGGTIEGFRITSAGFSGQGTLYCANDAKVSNCIITNNDTRGITFGSGSIRIVSSVISDNEDLLGAGIGCDTCPASARVFVDACIISRNRANGFGGAFHARGAGIGPHGCVTFRNCRIIDNVADTEGGGLNLNRWDAGVIDSLVAHNTAGSSGGAVLLYGSGGGAMLTLERSTVFINQPTTYIASDCQIIMRNSIVSDSFDLFGDIEFDIAYSAVPNLDQLVSSQDVTVIQGPGNIVADPLLSWHFLSSEAQLSPLSPAINAGDPDFVSKTDVTDYEGDPRVIYGRLDMGADEWFNAGDHDGDGDIDLLDFAAFQLCFTGNDTVTNFTDECIVFDADRDGLINLTDFAEFQRLFTGPQ